MLEIILIITNGFIYPSIHHTVRNFKKHFLELFTFLCLFSLSVGYHVCLLFGCNVYDFFWRFDQIFALQCVTCSFMNLVETPNVKYVSWILNFIANTITIYIDPSNLYTLLLSTVFFNLILISHIYKIYTPQKMWNFLKRNDIVLNNLCITLLLVAVGLVFFRLANIYENYYYIYHSIWHVFIFLSIFTSFFIKKHKKLTIELERNISLENFANFPKSP